jgi:hypothetical protein
MLGRGKEKGRLEGVAVAGKGESDLGFWEGEGEGWRGRRVAAGKGESDLGFWEGKRGRLEGDGGLAAGKCESDLGLGMILFIPFFLNRFGLAWFNWFKLF